MKTLLVLLLSTPLLCVNVNAKYVIQSESDSLKISKEEILDLNDRIEKFESDIKSVVSRQIKDASRIRSLENKLNLEKRKVDSLTMEISKLSSTVNSNKERTHIRIEEVNNSIIDTGNKLNKNITSKTKVGWTIICVLLLSFISFCFWLKKRFKKSATSFSLLENRIIGLHAEYDNYDKSIMNTNDKLLQVIEQQLKMVVSSENSEKAEKDHSLAVAVANEIARIQQNLNHMDKSVKGVSQLNNRVKAIITTLKSKQYDIPDLLGKEYHEGDNMSVTMELNEDLEIGKSIIKRVIKPQVSFEGKLIQEAEVVVEYNE